MMTDGMFECRSPSVLWAVGLENVLNPWKMPTNNACAAFYMCYPKFKATVSFESKKTDKSQKCNQHFGWDYFRGL